MATAQLKLALVLSVCLRVLLPSHQAWAEQCRHRLAPVLWVVVSLCPAGQAQMAAAVLLPSAVGRVSAVLAIFLRLQAPRLVKAAPVALLRSLLAPVLAPATVAAS